jgi:Flp pilus assembly protein TadB
VSELDYTVFALQVLLWALVILVGITVTVIVLHFVVYPLRPRDALGRFRRRRLLERLAAWAHRRRL